MDRQVGALLDELEQDDQAADTIVFFFSAHGVGLPRAKRWLYDSGIRVPLMVRWPGRIKPAGVERRLVSVVDFAPTVLSLAGVTIPDHLQGKAFRGDRAAEPRCYVYAARDRMDERYDLIRAVRDGRYKYIRNYEPQRPYAQYLSYADVGPTLKEFRRLHAAGLLSDPSKLFMRSRKPSEELYDTENDPHEIHNLVKLPKYQEVLDRLRTAQLEWMRQSVDTGLLPEPELVARAGREGIYAVVRKPQHALPLDRLHEVALFKARGPQGVEKLGAWMKDPDPAVRYWAATRLGLFEEETPQEPAKKQPSKLGAKNPAAGTESPNPPAQPAAAPAAAAQSARKVLTAALRDSAPCVRIAAARSLLGFTDEPAAMSVLVESLHDSEGSVRILAADALDNLGPKARPAVSALQDCLHDSNEYVVRIAKHALNELLGTSNEVK